MEEDINNLKEIVDLCEKEIKNNNYNTTATLDITDLKSINNLLNELDRLQKENKKLISNNLEYQRIQDIFDERTYRKKYLEERRKEEPNLLYPDADEIYKRYYKLREENEDLKNLANKKQWISPCYVAQNYIPVSLVEETIEELNKEGRHYNANKIEVLQELLEKRK